MQPKMTPRYAAGMALRFVLIMLLTFSVNHVWTTVIGSWDGSNQAYAAGEQKDGEEGDEKPAGKDDPKPEEKDDPEPEPKPDPKPEEKPDPKPEKEDPSIEDVAVVLKDTDKALGYASKGKSTQDGKIDKKGGTLELDSLVWWNDGKAERNNSKVQWSISDSSVATISRSGLVTAKGNGTVTVSAKVDGQYTKKGSDLVAKGQVKVTNQEADYYVKKIQILTPDNKVAKTYEETKDYGKAQMQFQAKVTVVNQDTGDSKSVTTKRELGEYGLSDILWSINDENIGAVNEDGKFRPSAYTTATITATSKAGQGGEKVTASIEVTTKDPEGGEVKNDAHPQESLTVKAYWETPPEGTTEENKYVIDKTYSLEDLQGMNVVEETYTALGKGSGTGGYYTMSGRGVYLSEILKDAGVDIKGMKSIAFGTHDKINTTVSANFVFDTDRFYYPNIDVNSSAGKKQVAPMIAFMSSEVKSGETAPNYDNLTDNTRFRLLFGAKRDGSNNSQYQIKWIHTLYVKMKGGPKVEEGKDDGKGDGGKDKDKGHDQKKDDGKGEGDSPAAPGQGNGGANGNTGGGTSGGNQGTDPSANGTGTTGQDPNASSVNPSASAGGGYKVYQVMSRYHHKTEKEVEYENPFAPYAAPLGAAVCLSGALESALWFRRQTRVVRFGMMA
ncbi:MAG: Ig-like domain-containing protein [Coriobacteriia bacterium]|nr:Ig-like domain-containing protein [Coriobacteriia bacterium]